jgi:hypothetical protein
MKPHFLIAGIWPAIHLAARDGDDARRPHGRAPMKADASAT